ncbi:alkylphosphonate ABC transporter [Photobacterium proteolyticum]|uniref:Alkylphosphonate ABC transporter n=1 Tax=Photobacterium proteolyticum TaxID=1903952 RepID=A0A1Q9GJL4_9GAMM|nr:phosphate/phosphite/phosphonate ABC transporter substrate-binding protein [Photobacterium proteolyticum]OLQ74700.1 alkylphosphonate ABC transporter [Photobacterium proteolyticum]
MRYNHSAYRLIILIVALLFSSLFTVSASVHNSNILREETLVVGVISTNPKKAFKRTQPIADYLAKNLQQHKITNALVVVAKDVRQMTRWIKNGQIDLVSETVFAAHDLVQNAGAQLLARRWKSGVAEYSSIFFSKLNHDVDSFDDLRNKNIAFEDRGSTSAYLIPAAILLEQGYELYEVTSPRELPPEGKIGYFFSDELSKSGGEKNMMSWVQRSIVAAAAFSNLDWEKEIPEQVQRQLQIIYTSQPIPRSLMLVRPNMPAELKQDILMLLLSAHQSEQGKQALTAYKKTKKFDAITSDIEQSIHWAGERKALVDKNLIR